MKKEIGVGVVLSQRRRSGLPLIPGSLPVDEEVLGLYHLSEGKLARAQMFYFDTAPVAKFLERAKHTTENTL